MQANVSVIMRHPAEPDKLMLVRLSKLRECNCGKPGCQQYGRYASVIAGSEARIGRALASYLGTRTVGEGEAARVSHSYVHFKFRPRRGRKVKQ